MNSSADPFYDDYFSRMIDGLELLSASAPEQCTMMDSYNTGWELRQDAIDTIEAVLASPLSHLPVAQIKLLRTLQAMAASLPPEAIDAPGKNMRTRDGCEAAMRHPAWGELRQYTAIVQHALEVSIVLHRGRTRE